MFSSNEHRFQTPRSRLGLLGAFSGFSGFAVLLFTPYIADILGRRMGTAVGCCLVILGSVIQALSGRKNPDAMFLAGRWILGRLVNNQAA